MKALHTMIVIAEGFSPEPDEADFLERHRVFQRSDPASGCRQESDRYF